MSSNPADEELAAKWQKVNEMVDVLHTQAEEKNTDLREMTKLLMKLTLALFEDHPLDGISNCECRWWNASYVLEKRCVAHTDPNCVVARSQLYAEKYRT